MTFQEQIESYVGSLSAVDTDLIDQWLSDGVRMLVGIIPEAKAMLYATEEAVDETTGLSLLGKRLVKILKNLFDVTLVSNNIGSLTDSDSIYYPTERRPAAYILEDILYIVPDGGEAYTITYPTLSYADETSTITTFPTELIPALVIKAAIRYLLQLFGDSIGDLRALEYYLAVPPTTPEDLTTIDAFGTLPIYVTPETPTIVYTNTLARLVADDSEMTQSELALIQVELQEYAKNQANANAKFQEELVEYEGSVKRALEVASLASKETFELYGMGLQKYGQEINNYTQKFQNELTKIVKRIEVNGIKINELKQELADIIGSYVNS